MAHEDCYVGFTSLAGEYGLDVPFQVKHIAEYLIAVLEEKRGPEVPLGRKIAVQNSCAGRLIPGAREWYDSIIELCGCTRVSRTYENENALCCGAHVAPYRGFREGLRYKEENIRDALSAGADSILFSCPFCALQMRDEAAEAGLEPIYMPSLVKMALGEPLSAHPAGLGDDRLPILKAAALNKGVGR